VFLNREDSSFRDDESSLNLDDFSSMPPGTPFKSKRPSKGNSRMSSSLSVANKNPGKKVIHAKVS